MKKYKTIVIDPPWEYAHRPGLYQNPTVKYLTDYERKHAAPAKNKPMPYITLSVEKIKELQIKKLADKNCVLFLWTTQKYIQNAIEIVKEWGFNYSSTLVWCKAPKGIVGTFRCSCEFIIYATKGVIKPKEKHMGTSFHWKRGKHSQKPEELQDVIERMFFSPYLELFARRKRPGWDVWGNEVESDIDLVSLN